MRLRAIVLGAVLLLAALGAKVSAQPSAPPYVVIVHARQHAVVDRSFLEDAFLKKITQWPDDEVIRPVDLPPGSPVRRRFSDDVLKRSVESVKNYWQQRIFSGRDVPPPELDSDEDVVRYVLKYEGAVGYVSGTTNLNGAVVATVR